MGNASDFQLPEEILRVLPTDPYEQLDLARKITSIAIASRVSKLESENSKLRQKATDKDLQVQELQDKLSHLENAFHDTNARLSRALEDQSKLANERNILASTVKKLNRDVAKLEAFKKTLMQSLNEEDEGSVSETTTSMATAQLEWSASSISSSSRDEAGNVTPANLAGSINTETSTLAHQDSLSESDAAKRYAQRFSLTPFLTPRRTPTGTPNIVSAAGSPKRSAVVSPRGRSASGSPTNRSYDSRISSSMPVTQHSTAPNSPPHGRAQPARTPRLDGKEFFRQARSRLSFEQFSAFLANIKELNAHRQTKEKTLLKAEEIFGPDNKDLYLAFEGLLSRHLR